MNNINDKISTVIYTVTKRTKQCGKRYLRNPERIKNAKDLYNTNIYLTVYRENQAEELMYEEDSEPLFLYSKKV